jgi:hypothetical protein
MDAIMIAFHPPALKTLFDSSHTPPWNSEFLKPSEEFLFVSCPEGGHDSTDCRVGQPLHVQEAYATASYAIVPSIRIISIMREIGAVLPMSVCHYFLGISKTTIKAPSAAPICCIIIIICRGNPEESDRINHAADVYCPLEDRATNPLSK